MRCRKCGKEILCRPCRSCQEKFLNNRMTAWNIVVAEMGKPTKETMVIFQKRMKQEERKLNR